MFFRYIVNFTYLVYNINGANYFLKYRIILRFVLKINANPWFNALKRKYLKEEICFNSNDFLWQLIFIQKESCH